METSVQKISFQKFTEIVAKEVYDALSKKYDVRNAVIQEIQPLSSSPIVVILVTSKCGLAKDEPCIKKMSQAYLEYDTIYHGNIKDFAKGYAGEVEAFYKYVNPNK